MGEVTKEDIKNEIIKTLKKIDNIYTGGKEREVPLGDLKILENKIVYNLNSKKDKIVVTDPETQQKSISKVRSRNLSEGRIIIDEIIKSFPELPEDFTAGITLISGDYVKRPKLPQISQTEIVDGKLQTTILDAPDEKPQKESKYSHADAGLVIPITSEGLRILNNAYTKIVVDAAKRNLTKELTHIKNETYATCLKEETLQNSKDLTHDKLTHMEKNEGLTAQGKKELSEGLLKSAQDLAKEKTYSIFSSVLRHIEDPERAKRVFPNAYRENQVFQDVKLLTEAAFTKQIKFLQENIGGNQAVHAYNDLKKEFVSTQRFK